MKVTKQGIVNWQILIALVTKSSLLLQEVNRACLGEHRNFVNKIGHVQMNALSFASSFTVICCIATLSCHAVYIPPGVGL